MKCDKCGAELAVGDFPFCPHGSGFAASHGDELDYIDHNLGRDPVHITSKAQRRQIMAERGLEEFIRHTPVPGTDHSPFTTDWSKGSIDPYTLAQAEALIARVHGKDKAVEAPVAPVANPFNFTATPEMVRELTDKVESLG